MSAGAHEPVQPNKPLSLGEPYCGACGYQLTGLVDSSKCPECGRPFVEVLTRAGRLGRRYRSEIMLGGLPLLDVAIGPTHSERIGSARGVIAIGDQARGWLAIGGLATGVVAVGGRAMGVFALGGIAVGLVSACGGISVAAIAVGGLALGLLGYGGVCAAIVADGGMAIGLYVSGGLRIPLGSGSPGDVFPMFSWFFGRTTPFSIWRHLLQPWVTVMAMPIVATGTILGVVAARALRARHGTE